MIKIKSGDQLTVECEYDSTKHNKTVMVSFETPKYIIIVLIKSELKGGFGTYDEMCAAFILYYPKMTSAKPCFSGLTDKTIRTLADIEDRTDLTQNSGLIDYISSKHDWNQRVLNKSYDIMISAKQKMECYWIKADDDIELGSVGYPQLKQLYKPPESQCNLREDQDTIISHFSNVVIISIIAITIAVIIAVLLVYYRRRIRSPSTNHNRLV